MTIDLSQMTEQQALATQHDRGPALVVASPGSGKCVTGDTLVLTEDGLRPIKELTANEKVVSANGEVVKTSHWFDMGYAEVLEVVTENGFKITGTYEHPIVVGINDDGTPQFKRLDQLKVGSSVALMKGSKLTETSEGGYELSLDNLAGAGYFFDQVQSVTPAGRQRVYDLTVPDHHSYVGNGFINHNTRVITYRLANLLSEGTNPLEIVAITFTNKAAEEMRGRITGLVGKKISSKIWISTFHSLCARFLRRSPNQFEVRPNFSIADEEASKRLVIQSVASITGTSEKEVSSNDPDLIKFMRKRIGRCKRNGILVGDVLSSLGDGDDEIFLRRVYEKYEALLDRSNMLDFDDLLLKVVLRLRYDTELQESYSRSMKYILVDEYQDTNSLQYELIKHLSSVHRNLFVVGDSDQSIFAFQGANPENISHLEGDFPDLKTYFLEENFRSVGTIARVANALIENNPDRKPKTIKPVRNEGSKVKWVICRDQYQEAGFIADEIQTAVSLGRASYKDFAVLYRVNSQSRVFGDIFTRKGIPHKIYGAVGFYQRALVKDILAYLQLIVNPYDDIAFTRIYNKPKRKWGSAGFNKFCEIRDEMESGSDEVVPFMRVLARKKYEDMSGVSTVGMTQLRSIMKHLRKVNRRSVAESVSAVIELTRYRESIEEANNDRTFENLDLLDELQEAASDFDSRHGGGISAFLEWVSLISSTEKSNEKETDRAVLMTCHRAKGMEFKRVYVVGCVEGLFPCIRYEDEKGRRRNTTMVEKDLEEERRVFFVGVTRAEDFLTLSTIEERRQAGAIQQQDPSRFIDEAMSSDAITKVEISSTDIGTFSGGKGGWKKSGYSMRKPKRQNRRKGFYGT